MTRMCPSYIPNDDPPGEVRIFHRLEQIEDDWTVIHSLDVAPSNNNKRTEIDFLVIIPDIGLLCIEVKSHRHISFDGQQWHPDSIRRSPFRQAEDAKHALVRRFKRIRNVPDGGHLPFPVGKVCIFSESPFDATSRIGINPSELIDSRQLEAMVTWQAFRDKLRGCLLSALRNDGIPPLTKLLSKEQINKILEECLPIQVRKAQSTEELAEAERNLRAMLREQQRPVLRLAESNPRLFVAGPPGTGKTLIAIELAKRFAEQGKRVGLLCFNRMLGSWLDEQLTGYPNVIAGTAHGVLSRITDVAIDNAKTSEPKYWNVDLPEAFQDRMTSQDFEEDYSFDILLVDECQDLLPRSQLWDCLMQLTAGGMTDGRWVMFGDFTNQAIASGDDLQERVHLLEASARPAHWELRENCRNLSMIGKTAEYLLGVEASIYDDYMRVGENPEFRKYLRYSSTDEQQRVVVQEVAALRSEGFAVDEIVLLSFCAERQSVGQRLTDGGLPFSPASRPKRGHISFTSINAFKGMEQKAVIVTDVEALHAYIQERSRLFVGATRATDRLRIVLTVEAADQLDPALNPPS